jgi:hypothetical protein
MNTHDTLIFASRLESLQSQASAAEAALAAATDPSARFEHQITLRGLRDRIDALQRTLNG